MRQFGSLLRAIKPLAIHQFSGLTIVLSALHILSPIWMWFPGQRLALPRGIACRLSLDGYAHRTAVPAMIFSAWSRSLALRSAILVSAISRTCPSDRGDLSREAHPSPSGLPRPSAIAWRPAGFCDEGKRPILDIRRSQQARCCHADLQSRRCTPCRTP